MKFEAPVENTRRNRNRKVKWFNPPYSLYVKPRWVYVIPNVKNLIKQHNSKILIKDPVKIQR